MGRSGFYGVGRRFEGFSDGLYGGLLRRYVLNGVVQVVTVDVNVEDVTVALFEVGQLVHVKAYRRARRNTGKLLFIRRVDRRSMRLHGRPATSWLKYSRNIENQWVNEAVGLVKKLGGVVDAVVVEDLSPAQLKAKLKSRNPDKAYVLSRWPVAKIMRRIAAYAEKSGKLLTVPPHYTSSLCPRCNSLTSHEHGRWDRLVCRRCGYRDDRDHVAVRNLLRTALVIEGFQTLRTFLGEQLRRYKEAIERLDPILLRDPEAQGPQLGGKGEATLPEYPKTPGLGYTGVGWLMNLSL